MEAFCIRRNPEEAPIGVGASHAALVGAQGVANRSGNRHQERAEQIIENNNKTNDIESAGLRATLRNDIAAPFQPQATHEMYRKRNTIARAAILRRSKKTIAV